MKDFLSFIKRFVTSPYLSLILRLYIGIVFIYASLSKMPYPAEFAESLAAYQILPYWSINFFAVIIPGIEMISGLFLVIGLRTKAASFVIGSLLTVFTIGIFINLIRDAPISCGCFDSIGHQISWQDIFRDIGWLALTIQIFLFDKIYFFQKEIFLRKKIG